MADSDLIQKIKQMSEYLDEEAIAAAIRIPAETVHDILQDRIAVEETETEKESVIQVATTPVYRQRIISIWRGRGGAGCTSVALHLAYLLEQMMSVLLVDMTTATAGSDIAYYLRLSEYPNMESLKDKPLSSSVIQVESGLWVLLPPPFGNIEKDLVQRFAVEARRDFDAVVFDLPNADDEYVQEGVACSNTLVMVSNGLPQEQNRLLARKNRSQKEVVFVANGCSCDGTTRREFMKVVEIPEDRDLPARMERGNFYKQGSPFTSGVERIRDLLFGMRPQEEGGFRKVLKLLRG